MIRVLSAALLAAALATPAAAVVFDYSFDNEDGAIDGSVVGEIVLPDGDGTFAASSVIVTSAPAGLGYDPTGFEFTTDTFSNSFTVENGEVTDFDFFGLFNGSTALGIGGSLAGDSTFLDSLGAINVGMSGVRDADNSSVSFSAAAIPLPATAWLMLAGLGGLAAMRRRSQGR